jgi:hypothetical protein
VGQGASKVRLVFLMSVLVSSCAGKVLGQELIIPAHIGVAGIPVGEEVYSFLHHLSVRGILPGYSETVLPLSEFGIVQFLKQVSTDELSESERELRSKFLQTYAREPFDAVTIFAADSAAPLFVGGIPTDKDKYIYRWRDTATNSDLQVNGLANLEFRDRLDPDPATVMLGMIGGRIRGTLSGHVGYFLEATNGSVLRGDTTIALEDPQIGKNKNFAVFSNHVFFDNTTAELSYNNDWFTANLARGALSIGGGYSGDNIFVSPGIPTIDHVSIGAHVGAVRYLAIVGSLLGDARYSAHLDSTLYNFGPGAYIDPKYIALHHVSITLGEVEFGFTDMTIFSRRFDLAYLNPFSFLKSVEHSLNDRDNGLLGAHVRWQITPGVEVRGQGLMDDVIFSRIGTGWWGNKFAWQFGVFWAAPFGVRDLDVAAEYTHVEPFMYSHFNTQNAFTTSGEIVGSGIGPNSKRFFGKLHYSPSAKLSFDLSGSLLQHGENVYDSAGNITYNAGGDVEITATSEAESKASYNILGGRRVNSFTLEGSALYEIWRGIQVYVRVLDRSVSYAEGTPQNPQVTPYRLFTGGIKATL